MAVGAEDRERGQAYQRMRWLAGALLALMLMVYLLAWAGEGRFAWLAVVRAFAEAAMVGGIADWFAVAALFRHPFGIPIPHTAIVPRNKERIGQSVGGFVANNFLAADTLLPKVKAMDGGGRLAAWLSQPANARFIARRLVAAVPPLVSAMRDEPVRLLLRDAALARLRAVELAPLLSRLLTILMAGGQHMAVFDLGLKAARTFVETNQDAIRQTVAEKSGWWVPEWVDEKLTNRFIAGSLETLDEMAAPDHPWRLQFEEAVTGLIDGLVYSPETRAKAEAVKDQVLAHPEVQAYFESLWGVGKAVLMADLSSGDRIAGTLTEALQGLGRRMSEDPALREVVNAWLARIVLHVVVPNRRKLGDFMAGVVGSWDTPTLVAKLELQVGRDLQYIRINGTLVGGAVGVAIHLLSGVMG